ncbi:MAG: chromosomal replication initiator protein DnaA [Muribaculaceae bacterium]|nr:chromosomal replication initiator protein DnaA [Muribaculaceae bacterium]
MVEANNNKWNECLRIIKDNLESAQYNSWFAPITVESFENNELTLRVPTAFYVEQLDGRFYNLLASTLVRVYGKGIKLKYSYDIIKDDPQAHVVSEEPHKSVAVQPMNPFAQQEKFSGIELDPQLNPVNTFENYCESKSNKLAYSIANAIATNPKCQTFNPMFIFGCTGVGKTHLIQAIGIKMKEENPLSRVLYVSARTFESQYTSAVRTNKVNDFINFYQSIDMLIVDDVQEFAGKTATQNTFFHIFNHLHNKQRHLILSCDCPPSELDGMEPRLLSRFKWGMIVELESPDYDLRRAVLLRKAMQAGVKIPDDILDFVAENVKDNVREIEGVFASLMAYSTALNQPLTIQLARNVLSNTVRMSKQNRVVTFDSISDAVCSEFNIDKELLFGKSRKRDVADARQLVMMLAKKFAKMSSTMIGLKLNRNHATVLYACKTIEERISVEKDFAAAVGRIEATLR